MIGRVAPRHLMFQSEKCHGDLSNHTGTFSRQLSRRWGNACQDQTSCCGQNRWGSNPCHGRGGMKKMFGLTQAWASWETQMTQVGGHSLMRKDRATDLRQWNLCATVTRLSAREGVLHCQGKVEAISDIPVSIRLLFMKTSVNAVRWKELSQIWTFLGKTSLFVLAVRPKRHTKKCLQSICRQLPPSTQRTACGLRWHHWHCRVSSSFPQRLSASEP